LFLLKSLAIDVANSFFADTYFNFTYYLMPKTPVYTITNRYYQHPYANTVPEIKLPGYQSFNNKVYWKLFVNDTTSVCYWYTYFLP